MALRWTTSARSDLVRLYEFLASVNPRGAALAVRHIVAGAKRIPGHPRLGQRLRQFTGREVRRMLIGDYEIRYELLGKDVYLLRIFHSREDR
jgi:plasmid stabilization system protein ParE